MASQSLTEYLMLRAPNRRHGIVLPPQTATLSMSDVRTLYHVGVPGSVHSPWESAAGGVGRNERLAQLAAIGEGIERFSAATVRVTQKAKKDIPSSQLLNPEDWALFTDEQRQRQEFPFHAIYDEECPYIAVYDCTTNECRYAPEPLVVLRDSHHTGVPTSNGLAAGKTMYDAMLRGLQELIERDALMVTWHHALAGREIVVPQRYVEELQHLEYSVQMFDLTPEYSMFPVIAVLGGVKKRGKWRYSLGVACKDTLAEAIEKAYLEWNQGVFFAGIYTKHVGIDSVPDGSQLASFDHHAIYYTIHPELWSRLPLLQNPMPYHATCTGKKGDAPELLHECLDKITKHNIRVYYRDITTADARQLGVSVVKVLSPDMASIHAHEQWPFLGRVDTMLESRYKGMTTKGVGNPYPHPLG